MAVELEDRVEDRFAQVESHIGRLQTSVGKLQSDVSHLQTDVTDIKTDARLWRAETNARLDKVTDSLARLEERVTRGDLQNRIWTLLSMGTVLAVMAHGFKWI